MAKINQLVTQSGSDTSTWVAIATGLTVDGKAGWQINGMSAYWVDGQSVAAADMIVNGVVSTVNTGTSYGDDDEVARVSWGLQNTAGTAVAVPFEPIKSVQLVEPRVTVQPTIYVGIISQTSGQANDMIFVVNYDIVRLSDNEVLRLLAGGA